MKIFSHCVNLWFIIWARFLMHHQSLWKGITIFSLTLGIGTFSGDFYDVREISENVSNEVRTVEKKNCRFSDPNLKFQTLPLKNESYRAELLVKPKGLTAPASKLNEQKSEAEEPENDLNKEFDKTHSESYNRAGIKSKEEYLTLLHKELCYESDGRK